MKILKLHTKFKTVLSSRDNKPLKTLTIDGYITKLLFLEKSITGKESDKINFNEKIFMKFDEVKEFIEKKYKRLETKRSYLVAILALLKAINKQCGRTGKQTRIYTKYKNYLQELIDLINDYHKTDEFKAYTCKITDEQLKELLEKRKLKFHQQNKSSDLQNIIIMKLYIEQTAVRADYVNTILINGCNEDTVDKTKNYIDLKNKKSIIFNHKTEDGGILRNPINEDIILLMNKLLKLRKKEGIKNNEYLLLKKNGDLMTPGGLSMKIKRLTGCSINDLRKRPNRVNKETLHMLGEMGEQAKAQGHSLATHIKHYVKV